MRLLLSLIAPAVAASTLPLLDAFVLLRPLTPTKSTGPSPSRSFQLNAESSSEASKQNVFGILSDAATGAAFSLLHAFDPDPISDSSKNLRVLWVRALLHASGMIQDEIAATFLPPTTRGLVISQAGAKFFQPWIKFAEWIQARTEFIDQSLDHFLSSPLCSGADGATEQCNIVLFGSGYDTRVLRNRHAHDRKIHFIEVDLPSVTNDKHKLYQKFQKETDPTWNYNNTTSTLVPLDLNDCGNDKGVSLVQTLIDKASLDTSLPTLFVWEAVLFYVNEDAVRNIMRELFDYANVNESSPQRETMLVMTDSLKPFVRVPFSNEARQFFDRQGNMDLLQHRSRWGGAVHFCLAASRSSTHNQQSNNSKDKQFSGKIAQHVSARVGGLVNSYTPTAANNPSLLEKPSFENVWYAVAYSWQVDGYDNPLQAVLKHKKNPSTGSQKHTSKPFATRLWGEPLVIYRDSMGELVAMTDVCPHRSAPLSSGKIENNQLVCAYHGWRFGPGGSCTDVPTLQAARNRDTDELTKSFSPQAFLDSVTKANCAAGNMRAVAEHDGLVYVWRGHVLEADISLLPSRRKGDMETVLVDTVLDYNVDYSYIVENNLDSPHLFYLHDGSVPPIESIGMLRPNLPKLKLKAFTDDCGIGHLGSLEKDGRPKKLIRFDPPNIVRHGGVSGFEEEFHIVPVAPQRTRVLLRQHLPRGPILSTITSFPFVQPLLTVLVNNWNYHIALEDAGVMQGQANRVEDWAAPRMLVGGLGDDLIKKYWTWRSKAHESLRDGETSPYYSQFANKGSKDDDDSTTVNVGIPSGTVFGDEPTVVAKVRQDSRLRNVPLARDNQDWDAATGSPIGSWGIKFDYLQETPAAEFPPINYKQYANMLVFDGLVKGIFARAEKDEYCEPMDPPLKSKPRQKQVQKSSSTPEPVLVTAATNVTVANFSLPV